MGNMSQRSPGIGLQHRVVLRRDQQSRTASLIGTKAEAELVFCNANRDGLGTSSFHMVLTPLIILSFPTFWSTIHGYSLQCKSYY